jgi:hypothetical protein
MEGWRSDEMARQWRWIMDPKEDPNTIVLDLSGWDRPENANEIYISDFDSMITSITPTPTPTITIGDSTSWNWSGDTITLGDVRPSSKITLEGAGADIEVNGESLMSMIRGIQDRLNILTPDKELEREWDELRILREQYESKLAECREKSRAWNALKQSG